MLSHDYKKLMSRSGLAKHDIDMVCVHVISDSDDRLMELDKKDFACSEQRLCNLKNRLYSESLNFEEFYFLISIQNKQQKLYITPTHKQILSFNHANLINNATKLPEQSRFTGICNIHFHFKLTSISE